MFLCMVIIYVAASFHQLFLATFFCQLVSKSCSQLLLVVGQFLSVVLNYSYDQKVYISCVFYYCQLSASFYQSFVATISCQLVFKSCSYSQLLLVVSQFPSVVLTYSYDQKVYISCVFYYCQLSASFYQSFVATISCQLVFKSCSYSQLL